MVIEAVTGIFGGKKKKKAAKKQKRIAMQQAALSREASKEIPIQEGLAKEQFALERAAVSQQRVQDRLATVRAARIARSQLLQAGASSGAGLGSSAITGAVGGLVTQFGSTLGIANIFNRLQDQASEKQSKIMESQSRVSALQAKSAELSGQSAIVEAKLQKDIAGLDLISSIGRGVLNTATAVVTGGKGNLFQTAFGGGKATSSLDAIFKTGSDS